VVEVSGEDSINHKPSSHNPGGGEAATSARIVYTVVASGGWWVRVVEGLVDREMKVV